MANNPFDRVIFNPREKPLSKDINRAQASLDYSLRYMAEGFLSKRISDTSDGKSIPTGFLGNDFRVVPSSTPDMFVTVKRGTGFYNGVTDTPQAIGGIVGLDDLANLKPMLLMADTVFAVPAAPGVNSRIDIIEARVNRLSGDPDSRLVLNTSTGAFEPTTVNKTMAFVLDGSIGAVIDPALSTAALSYKQGIVAAVPVEPTVTPGYVKIARINVGTSVVVIRLQDLVDRRPLLGYGGIIDASVRYRIQWNAGVPIVTVQSVVAPPSIQFAIDADNAIRSNAIVCVVGGEIQEATYDATTQNPLATAESTDMIHSRLSVSPLAGGSGPVDSTAAEATGFQTNEVPIFVGAGTRRVSVKINGLYISAAGAGSITNAGLEDIIHTVGFKLSY